MSNFIAYSYAFISEICASSSKGTLIILLVSIVKNCETKTLILLTSSLALASYRRARACIQSVLRTQSTLCGGDNNTGVSCRHKTRARDRRPALLTAPVHRDLCHRYLLCKVAAPSAAVKARWRWRGRRHDAGARIFVKPGVHGDMTK